MLACCWCVVGAALARCWRAVGVLPVLCWCAVGALCVAEALFSWKGNRRRMRKNETATSSSGHSQRDDLIRRSIPLKLLTVYFSLAMSLAFLKFRYLLDFCFRLRTGLSLLDSAGAAGDGVDIGAAVGCGSISGGGVSPCGCVGALLSLLLLVLLPLLVVLVLLLILLLLLLSSSQSVGVGVGVVLLL